MGASSADARTGVLDRLLRGDDPARKSALLGGLAGKLHRASDLPELARRAASVSEREALSAAIPGLGRLLPGGLPRGGLVELTGPRSAGRFSLELAALAATTSTGRAAAFVDLGDHFDPQAAESAGVDLEYVLWARPRRVKEALASAEMLLAAGFPLVVADLGLRPRARFTPDAVWVRLARAAQAQGATLLLSAPWRLAGIASDAVVSGAGVRSIWKGEGASPRLLEGIASRVTLEKLGRATPGSVERFVLAVSEARDPEPRAGARGARGRLREGSAGSSHQIPRLGRLGMTERKSA